jgi:molybdopterin synthase sulfur carrier subunit
VPELTVRYFAAARAASGTHSEVVAAGTVDEAVKLIIERHGDGLARVLTACSLLLDGRPVGDRSTPLSGDVGLDVLPPFAGG